MARSSEEWRRKIRRSKNKKRKAEESRSFCKIILAKLAMILSHIGMLPFVKETAEKLKWEEKEIRDEYEGNLEAIEKNVNGVGRLMEAMESKFKIEEHKKKFEEVQLDHRRIQTMWKSALLDKDLFSFPSYFMFFKLDLNNFIDLLKTNPPKPISLEDDDEDQISDDESDSDDDKDSDKNEKSKKEEEKKKEDENSRNGNVNGTGDKLQGPTTSGMNGNSSAPSTSRRMQVEYPEDIGEVPEVQEEQEDEIRSREWEHEESTDEEEDLGLESDEEEHPETEPLGRKRRGRSSTGTAAKKQKTDLLREIYPRSEQKKRAKKSFIAAAEDYCTINAMLWSMEGDERGFGEVEKKKLFEFGNQEEEKIESIEYELPLKQEMPDRSDYRRIAAFLKEKISPKPVPLPIGGETLSNGPFWSLRFTGAMYIDAMLISGEELLKKAKESMAERFNKIFEASDKIFLPSGTTELVEEEMELIEKECGIKEPEHLPIRVFTAKTKEELFSEEYCHTVTTTPISILRNVAKVLGLKVDLFSADRILEKTPEAVIFCMRQLPQRTDANVTINRGNDTRSVVGNEVKVQFQEFQKYLTDYKAVARKGFLELVDPKTCTKDVYEKVKKEVLNVRLGNRKKGKKPGCRTVFGTNVDIEENIYEEQLEEIKKFPKFLQPNSPADMMTLCGEKIAGMNQAQAYLKTPGSRTYSHQENACFSSFNMNLGPAPVVWYGVPVEFSQQMKDAMKGMFLSRGYWLSELTLKERGIPYYKFAQQPGDIVYVGPGTFHWVSSQGFASHISWNMAPALSAHINLMAVHHDLFVGEGSVPLVSIGTLLWNIAEKNLFVDQEEMYRPIKTMLARSLACSQMELERLEATDPILLADSGLMVNEVERCAVEKCRKVLGNTLVASEDMVHENPMFFCLKHAEKILNRRVFVRSPLSKLVDIFDNYKPTI